MASDSYPNLDDARADFDQDQFERQARQSEALATRGETASTAMAAKAQAMVQAAYLVARGQPREWLDVRSRLLEACRRPRFAEKARYSVPRGEGKARGLSIRFAEEALRCMGNVSPETQTIYDDDDKRIISVTLTDLERNVSWKKDVTLQKRVERKKLQEGQQCIGTRINNRGDTLYIVKATDDEMLDRENALVSKAMRSHVLRLLPADIQEDCEEELHKTMTNEAARDPKEQAKKLADAFGTLGVRPSQIKDHLRCELDSASPAQLTYLREVYTAIRDGQTTWADVAGDDAKDPGEGAANLREKVRAKTATATQPAPAATPPPPAAAPAPAPVQPAAAPPPADAPAVDPVQAIRDAQMAQSKGKPHAPDRRQPGDDDDGHICMAPRCTAEGTLDPKGSTGFFCEAHLMQNDRVRKEWVAAWPHAAAQKP